MAGALWAPPEQLLLEDFVGTADLPSAIRLNSTARSLGVLFGPVVGSALLLGLGPVHGIWVNIAFYLPLTFLAARTRFTGHTRYGVIARQRVGALAAAKVFRDVSKDRVLAVMIILAGLGSFFIGSAMQTVMPTIADTTTGISSGTAYGLLLFANGLGGVLGGVLLEGTGWIRLSVRAALWSTLVYGASTVFFAISHDYLVAAPLLVIGGIANLAALSITQTVTQLRAPREKKGQVIGVYSTSANGMRIGSGFTVGLFGAAIGLRPASPCPQPRSAPASSRSPSTFRGPPVRVPLPPRREQVRSRTVTGSDSSKLRVKRRSARYRDRLHGGPRPYRSGRSGAPG